ncbi:MAG: hypothetical protein ACI81V_001484 [Lentimonas sp.]|jgi:hypothetical protein
MKKMHGILLLAAMCLLSGCMKTTAYYWGDYEEQVYQMYAAPDQASALVQLEALEGDLQKAASLDQPLPPGMRAHMGFLYYQLNRYDEARAAFAAEKSAFPESALMMERFIDKTGGRAS